ncbi:predicted protein [Histoplasma capsulatum H143]|uniref:Uncharacterized protein n=1 Tax=Ajellomyces capsulatus (strain H143) TaxID=544712 RepID=C6HM18_AJECH|nr:predicted protein [Histoplasma capsulatum H143]
MLAKPMVLKSLHLLVISLSLSCTTCAHKYDNVEMEHRTAYSQEHHKLNGSKEKIQVQSRKNNQSQSSEREQNRVSVDTTVWRSGKIVSVPGEYNESMSPLAISTIIVICGPSVQEANWNSMDGFERKITLKREITDVESRKCREENGQEREHCKTLNTRQRAVSFNDPLHSSTACSFFLRPLLPCKQAWNVAEGGRGWVVDRVGVPYGMRILLSKADLSNK